MVVTLAYLDTSAAMKLLVAEPESEALRRELSSDGRQLVASWLLHTELHCAVGRRLAQVSAERVLDLLDAVELIDLSRGDLVAASAHAPLGAGDAIHLAVAVRLGVDEMISYDAELARAATAVGLRVLAPK